MISSATTGPPTFAASAYCVQYKSIACEAASGHTCRQSFMTVSVSTKRSTKEWKEGKGDGAEALIRVFDADWMA